MMSDKRFQRVGAESNAEVGRDFEDCAKNFFQHQGLQLRSNYPVSVGAAALKKIRRFDLGCDEPLTLIECKSHRWTAGNNIPSAKITVWNESMYYFHLVPPQYRRIMFVLKDLHQRHGQSLAEYYVKNYGHLIPSGVELWEYDAASCVADRVC